MAYIATLPMYDWPERRSETDAQWAALREALGEEGFDPPGHLTRGDDLYALWLAPDLLIGETCIHPLMTSLRDKVRYVATPVHNAPGNGIGTYRSAIVRREPGADVAPPNDETVPVISADAVKGRMAANMADSMSGYVAPTRDMARLGIERPDESEVLWTGAHRESVKAVATGQADFAAIDCFSWQIALEHEPAGAELRVCGWTAARPSPPLIASTGFNDSELERIRSAVLRSIEAVVLEIPD